MNNFTAGNTSKKTKIKSDPTWIRDTKSTVFFQDENNIDIVQSLTWIKKMD